MSKPKPKLVDLKLTEFETYKTPEEFYAPFANQPYSALLTGKGMDDNSRYSFIGINPFYIHISNDDPFADINELLDYYSVKKYGYPLNLWSSIGFISYDSAHFVEELPKTTVDSYSPPKAAVVFYKDFIVFDHQDKKNYLIQALLEGDLLTDHREIFETKNKKYSFSADKNIKCMTKEEYCKNVERIIDYIKKGDVYEVSLSHQCTTMFKGEPYAIFQKLYGINSSPFSAYLAFGDYSVICNSPERFLFAKGDKVETRPIKGTSPRGKTPKEDDENRIELLTSEKDSAELAMIVDLLRNDLGKVSEFGSVAVKDHRRIEAFNNVWHLISIIESRLKKGVKYGDLLKACFPGGSITGCPKIRSMEIIDELEKDTRHLYTGTIFVANDARFDSNIVIRTIVAHKNNLYFNVGGAVVYDSIPEKEYEETMFKAGSIFASL
ncbi:aminodeoxychorismate synthase, component I [bacterium]|nr:aminodeoxychorismate synthase, component I [bacterium]